MWNYVVYIIGMYVFISIVEWVVHRHIMHFPVQLLRKTFEGHLAHHKSIRPDMTLDTSIPEYVVLDNTESLCMFLPRTWPILLFAFVVAGMFAKVLRVHYGVALLLFLTMNVYTMSMWNTMHPYMHGRDGYVMGCPLAQPKGSWLYDWMTTSSWANYLIQYHTKHHLLKGDQKPNFNVTMPLADYLFGTYAK